MTKLTVDTSQSALDWINASLKQVEPDTVETSDVALNDPLSKKLLFIQSFLEDYERQLGSRVNNSIITLLQTLQKPPAELENMRNQLGAFSVSADAASRPVNSNSSTLSQLKDLSTIKSNMEKTKLALKAIEKWNVLAADLDSLLASNDLESATARFSEAKLALELIPLSKRPQKEKILQTYSTKIEGVLSSTLVATIQSNEKTKIAKMYRMFNEIDKSSEFFNFYYSVQSKEMVQVFDSDVCRLFSSIENTHFCSDLSCVLNQLIVMIEKQLVITSEFSDSLVLQRILSNVMAQFSKKLAVKLESLAKSSIYESFNSIYSFCTTVESLVGKSEWFNLAIEPFSSHQTKFAQEMVTESSLVLDKMFTFTSPDDYQEIISSIEERMPLLFKHADSLLEICKSFTLFQSFNNWIKAVDFMLQRYSKSLKKLAKDVEAKSTTYKHSEWTLFQTGLGILALFMLFIDSFNKWSIQIQLDRLSLSASNLQDPFQSSVEFMNSCILKVQSSVFSVLYGPIGFNLQQLQQSNLYSDKKVVEQSPFNLEIPQFSLSPSTYLSQIGDYLLTLPQNLEMYADHPAIGFSLKSLPGCSDIQESMHHAYFWLVSLTKCTMQQLLDLVLGVEPSKKGLKQMTTDIVYIINVASAMELDPLPRLEELQRLLESPDLSSSDVQLYEKVSYWRGLS